MTKGRRFAKKIIIDGIVTAMPRIKANGHRILAYHLVLREDRKQFEDHIKFLTDYFKICSVAEVFDAAHNRKHNGEYRLAITFDDGFRVLMGDCLEVLEKFGVKACFFIPTGFVELSDRPELAGLYSLGNHYYNMPLEPMHPEDLKLLVGLGHEFGSHGVSHISFGAMSIQMAKRELEVSREKIVDWTGKVPYSFAYPYGQTRSSIADLSDLVRSSKFIFGLTMRRGKLSETSNPYRLPRDHAEGNWSLRDLRYFLFS